MSRSSLGTRHSVFTNMLSKFDLRVSDKFIQKVDNSKNLSKKCLSKYLWWRTFSLKQSLKACNIAKRTCFSKKLCFMKLLFSTLVKKSTINQPLVRKDWFQTKTDFIDYSKLKINELWYCLTRQVISIFPTMNKHRLQYLLLHFVVHMPKIKLKIYNN